MSQLSQSMLHKFSSDIAVHQLRAFKDNYLYVIQSLTSDAVVAIDPGDAGVVDSFLKDNHLRLTAIWNTHHHWDHTGGNKQLQKKYDCVVIGPNSQTSSTTSGIPALTHATSQGDQWSVGDIPFHVLATPGHTLDHLVYYAPVIHVLFCGDTLFSLGCGRLFEGTPEMMWQSLLSVRQLPSETVVFCAHEYTLSNWRFLQSLQPENSAINQLGDEIKQKLQNRQCTIPTTLAFEKQFNPFLLADDKEFVRSIPQLRQEFDCSSEKSQDISPAAIFAKLRSLKDQF